MGTIIFVAEIPLRGASIISFEFSTKKFCFLRCGGMCDEKVRSNVGVGESKLLNCGWDSVPEGLECDSVPEPDSRRKRRELHQVGGLGSKSDSETHHEPGGGPYHTSSGIMKRLRRHILSKKTQTFLKSTVNSNQRCKARTSSDKVKNDFLGHHHPLMELCDYTVHTECSFVTRSDFDCDIIC